jgi:homoprotocatechuate degradation regulator HpaR
MNKRQNPELPTIRASLPIALLRAREALMGPIREMLVHSDLTEQQWRVLRVLQEFGELEGARLAERACLLPPSLSRILAGMEKRGLVVRTRHENDRRRQLFRLSEGGIGLLDQNATRAMKIAEDTRSKLGDDKIDDLLALLAEVSALKDKP